MKISEIEINATTRVETTTDAHSIVDTEFRRNAYIERYGNVDACYDADSKSWRIPAFKTAIEKYSKNKAKECQRWGCE